MVPASVRASVRRVLGFHSLMYITTVAMLVAVIPKWEAYQLVYVFTAGVLALWFIVDAAIVFRYLRIVTPVTGPQNFSEIFFRRGRGWKDLYATVQEVEPIIRQALQRAESFPELRIKTVLKTKGATAAYRLIEAAENQRASDAVAAEDKKTRDAKRARDAAELLSDGIKLGIDPDQMRRFLAKDGLDDARAAIVQKKQANAIQERARACFCEKIVASLVAAGKLKEAEAAVLKAGSLLERARALEIEPTVRSNLVAGALGVAETEVAGAEERQQAALQTENLQTQVRLLPQARQAEARMLLEKLGYFRYGTREYRKALHELQRCIDR